MNTKNKFAIGTILVIALALGLVFIGHAVGSNCQMTVNLPADLVDAGATVNIRNGPSGLGNGGTFNVGEGTNFQWSLTTEPKPGKKFTSGWKAATGVCNGELTVTGDDYCKMPIVIPESCPLNEAPCDKPEDCTVPITVNIRNLGNGYKNGDTVTLPTSINIQYSVTTKPKDGKKFTSGWKTKHVDCNPLTVGDNDLCCMHINIPDEIKDIAKVNIRNLGTYEHCNCVCLPMGINIQWSLTTEPIEGKKFTSGWKTKNVDCNDLVVTGADYCKMGIVIPDSCPNNEACDDAEDCTVPIIVNIRNLGNGYVDGDTVTLPTSINIQYSVTTEPETDKKFTSGWKIKHVDCLPLNVEDSDLCCMHINIPDEIKDIATVNIRNLGTYEHCNCVCLPMGINIQWSLTTEPIEGKKFTSGWKTKNVDCNDLVVTGADYCKMGIVIPESCPPNTACGVATDCTVPITVNIRNLGNGYVDGQTVKLPTSINIQYSVTTEPKGGKKFTSGWKTKHVDCNPLTVGDNDLCCMHINIPDEIKDIAKVNIRNLGTYEHCNCVCLPQGINIQWSLTVSGFTSGWKTKNVDCNDLVVTSDDYCEVTFKFGWTNDWKNHKTQIRNGALVNNGGSEILPTGINIQVVPRVYGHNLGGWHTKTIDCSWQTLTWGLIATCNGGPA